MVLGLMNFFNIGWVLRDASVGQSIVVVVWKCFWNNEKAFRIPKDVSNHVW